jgi:hypothetical protein
VRTAARTLEGPGDPGLATGGPREEDPDVKITYDTVTDSISCPDLSAEQTQELQRQLSAALMRNDPVQTVAATIMTAVRAAAKKD